MADANDVQNLVDQILIAIGKPLTGMGRGTKRWVYDYARRAGYITLNDRVWSLTQTGKERVATLMAKPKA